MKLNLNLHEYIYLNLHEYIYLNLHEYIYLNLHEYIYLNLHEYIYLNLHEYIYLCFSSVRSVVFLTIPVGHKGNLIVKLYRTAKARYHFVSNYRCYFHNAACLQSEIGP